MFNYSNLPRHRKCSLTITGRLKHFEFQSLPRIYGTNPIRGGFISPKNN